MKRDLELLRTILLAAEGIEPGYSLSKIESEHDHSTVGEHVRLLKEEGYIDAQVPTGFGPGGAHMVLNYNIIRLTAKGHDFLANAKNESAWKSTIKLIKDKSGDVSLGILKATLAKAMQHQLGL